MSLSLIFDIATSLLLARWKQTLVAAIGVTFGVTAFIALLGFMSGLNELLDGLILNRIPHVRLYQEIKPSTHQPVQLYNLYRENYNFIRSLKSGYNRNDIYNSQALLRAVKQDSSILGAAPRVTAQSFFSAGAINITGVVNGIDVESEVNLFHFGDYVIGTDPIELKNTKNGIVLGKILADQLLVEIGDIVYLTTADGRRFPLKVVGFFQSGLADIDKVQSYASLATVQKLMGKSGSYVTDIALKLKNIDQAPVIATQYSKLFSIDAEDIQTANAQFETGSSIRSIISYSVGITLLIVAGFGIYNILNMMIYEQMDTIAILKAIGFSGKDIERIFLIIALAIGVAGGIAGLCVGFLLSFAIDQVPFTTRALPTITTYPVNYSLVFYIIGFAFSMITTYLAGWFPSKKASRTDPVSIIRGK
ncbi:FtsX-like permease family protein [Pedobacter sp. Du54]|uniref:ABC transporter permease n=1 Tax=Pedobacter anseongensis TaxID=3133439 RepID=UPI0030B5816F